ncbi:MAG TPA: SAM-dependent methyltransferase [Actinospica sp.]|nr:SAM-dependent methyltransferase [Actinospica sp.]
MDFIDAAEFALSLPEIDPNKPSPARIYDFWLGGSQNFAVDRQVGQHALAALPNLADAIRANRAFLGRVVHHLAADLGVTQFLDLGSGVPTVGNVHEVARFVNPTAKVLYVDIDPVAIAHARALLAEVDGVEAILADLRRPETVLGHPLLRETLDLSKPIAVLMYAVLHFIPDAEHPEAIVRAYTDRAAPGSYLALSHGAPDTGRAREQNAMLNDYQQETGVPFITRDADQITAWVAGLDIQPPGLVTIDRWRPEPDIEKPQYVAMYGVLARKPDTLPAGDE